MRIASIFCFWWLSIWPVFAQGHARVVYWSRDHTLQAIVVPKHINDPDFHEHAVEIRTKSGALLHQQDYSSADHDHGRCILEAAWSPDSQFFAFASTSSGGHSSWHTPIYVYKRAPNKIYYLDDAAGGPLVGQHFFFTAPAVIHAQRLNYKDGKKIAEDPIPVSLDLHKASLHEEV
jgi:hypothetical protein